ncbi:MAG: class II fructose-1,6-bisphosphate aldolase [Christensenellales bacterium]
MSLVNANVILKKAQAQKYAVGAFNFSNLEQLKAILTGAQNKNCDVIVQTSESAINYMGLDVIASTVKTLCNNLSIDVCLNLDHGKSFEMAKKCIDAGWTNVMIDASDKAFDENVKLTKQVVDYAHKYGVTVEAELGSLKGTEDNITSASSLFTKPQEAKDFAKQTNIDSLAISIGTSHGAYKFEGESYLDISRLKQIKSLIDIPLVLHGASSVDQTLKQDFVKSGGSIGNANGVSQQNLVMAIQNGICKINVDTDLRIAFTTGVRNALKDSTMFDPRKYLLEGMKTMQKQVENKIEIFLSNKK